MIQVKIVTWLWLLIVFNLILFVFFPVNCTVDDIISLASKVLRLIQCWRSGPSTDPGIVILLFNVLLWISATHVPIVPHISQCNLVYHTLQVNFVHFQKQFCPQHSESGTHFVQRGRVESASGRSPNPQSSDMLIHWVHDFSPRRVYLI